MAKHLIYIEIFFHSNPEREKKNQVLRYTAVILHSKLSRRRVNLRLVWGLSKYLSQRHNFKPGDGKSSPHSSGAGIQNGGHVAASEKGSL